VPAAGGTARMLAQALPVPERDYFRLSYRWHPTHDRLVYLKDDRLFIVDFDEKGPSAPRALAPQLGVLGSRTLVFTPDGSSVLVGISPRNDALGRAADGRPSSYALVPIDGGEPIRLDFDHEYLLEEPLGPAPGSLWQSADGAVLFRAVHQESGDAAVLSLSPRTRTSTLVWRASGELSSPAVAEDGDIVAVYSDNHTPPDVYRFSRATQSKTRLTEINPALAQIETGVLHLFNTVVPLYDGTLKSVRTMVRMPAGAKPDHPPPAVVFVYPESNYLPEAHSFGIEGNPLPAALLTTRGYAVVYTTVDIGPGDERGDAIREIADALLPQIRRAADLGFIDIRRVAVTGSSFGGFSTAAVVSQTNLFRAAIPMNGVYDLGGNYGYFGKRMGDAPMVDWTEHIQPRIGGPIWSDVARVVRNSPYYNADKIHTPMLIMQGGDDVFVVEAQKLFVALRRLGRPVQLAVYAGSGHVLSDWPCAQAIDGAARIVNFLDRWLKAPETAGAK
jgi:dipeptidyl aminopeptidase/acylaminoacyl peptidase